MKKKIYVVYCEGCTGDNGFLKFDRALACFKDLQKYADSRHKNLYGIFSCYLGDEGEVIESTIKALYYHGKRIRERRLAK